MTSEMEALLRTASYAAANVASLDALRSNAVGERDSGAPSRHRPSRLRRMRGAQEMLARLQRKLAG